MSNAIVRFNKESNKYECVLNNQVIAKSKARDYFEYHNAKGDVPKLVKAKITSFTYADAVAAQGNADAPASSVAAPTFSIDERFELMDELLAMTINGSTKAMLIAGKGGIGKTYAVMKKLQDMGKVNVNTIIEESMENGELTLDDGDAADAQAEVEARQRLMAELDSRGDYKVVKGFVTPAALYRLLYENSKRTIVFDDCDSVLRHEDAVNLLKGALDTYEERWISWNTSSSKSDLPPCFKFQGQIIFITNLSMNKIDEAVRTRCFKVDVEMTKPQRVERMKTVLPHVMPDIDMEYKEDAISLLEANLEVAADVSFRSLMNLIKIRVDPTVKDWEKLGRFALIEN